MQWYQPISKEVFSKKYMINGEKNEEEVFDGIATEVSRLEKNQQKWKNIFYELLSNQFFIPAGRQLANCRPNSRKPFYNNCFRSHIGDSMEEIYDTVKLDAMISKYGGGNGINYSTLRPKGAPTSREGVSCGPVGFMKVFNASGKVIMTGGARRSARISLLNDNHPDIEEFISCKQGDLNKGLTQMNLSVVFTNKFMETVKNNGNWDLSFDNKTFKTIKAAELFEKFLKNAYCVSHDTVLPIYNQNNDLQYLNLNEVKQKFDNGEELYAVSINPITLKQEKKKILKVFNNGKKELMKITTQKNLEIKCTKDHRLFHNLFNEIKAEQIIPNITKICLSKTNCLNNNNKNIPIIGDMNMDEDFCKFIGLWIGDGSFGRGRINFSVNEKEIEKILPIIDKISKLFNRESKIHKEKGKWYTIGINSVELYNFMINHLNLGTKEKKKIPEFLLTTNNLNLIKSFLTGYLNADGSLSVTSNRAISYYSKYKHIAYDVKLLLNRLGIKSRTTFVTHNKGYTGYRTEIPYIYHSHKFYENIEILKPSIFTLDDNFKYLKYPSHIVENYNEIYNYTNRSIQYKQNTLISIDKFKNLDIRNKILNSDLEWEEVKKIEIIPDDIVFDLEIENNHNFIDKNGVIYHNCHNEPGAFFIDKVEEDNNSWELKLDGCNPCLSGDNWVTTSEGPKQIKNIINKYTNLLYNGEYYPTTEKGFFKTGNKEVYEITTDKGYKIKATNNHNLLTNEGWKEVKNLKINDKLILSNNENNQWSGMGTKEEGWLVGNLIGDGCIQPSENPNTTGISGLTYWGDNKHEMYNIARKYLNELYLRKYNKIGFDGNFEPSIHKNNNISIKSTELTNLAENWGVVYENKKITNTIEQGSSDFYKGIIGGLFDADGSVWDANHSITVEITQSDKDLLERIQRMLSRLGIISKIYLSKPEGWQLCPGSNFYQDKSLEKYYCNAQYSLRITTQSGVNKFFNIIFINDNLKIAKYKKILEIYNGSQGYKEKYYTKITEIKCVGFEDVYDCQIPGLNSFDCNGIITHNCGELPLPPNGVCNLGAMNLVKYVINPFEDNCYFDFTNFILHISYAVRFLDNIIDIGEFPSPEIKEMQYNWRRLGLGFTGLADVFVMMKIKYGSPESIKLTEQICEALRNTSYIASVELAAEKGPFLKYNYNKIIDRGMVKKLPSEIKDLIKKHGLRNIGLNTIAPTGTTSLSIGQNCSSGIEGIFNIWYDRTISLAEGEKKTEKIYDYAYLLYKQKYGEEAKLPDYFVTTLDIDPYKAIDVQSTAQKYIDHSISRTINLPFGYTFDQYKNLFMYAFDKGLKGLTTFNQEGSMEGILKHKEIEHIVRRDAPERPQDLQCEIHSTSIGQDCFYVLAGLLNGTLYETFILKVDKEFKIPAKEGIIHKAKKRHYNLIIDNKIFIDNIVEHMGDRNYERTARQISLELRHGIKLEHIINNLNNGAALISFDKAISRVLKKYIKDGEIVSTREKCPNCGAKLAFYDGCKRCSKNCGYMGTCE